MTALAHAVAAPEVGKLVEVRGHRWVVADVDGAPPQPDTRDCAGGNETVSAGMAGSTLVELQSVEDGRYGESLSVVWEVEPGRRVLPAGSLPEVDGRFDEPAQVAAFLDAVRWGAATSADVNTLQAPFRSGVAVEDYQLEPVARALTAPRVNLLLADDVGLGKTIEAGLVVRELLLRHRARRVMVVCPAGLAVKWRDEMADKFGLDFTIVNSEQCAVLRHTHGSAANPFRVYPLVIVSLPWLRSPRAQRLLDEVLPSADPHQPPPARREFDLLVLDEAHHVAPAAPKQRYAVDSQQTKLLRRLVPHFEHRLFLSATPHNGYPESFQALLELLDDQRFARGVEPDETARREVVVRRLKRDVDPGGAKFPLRHTEPIEVTYPDTEREVHDLLTRFAQLRATRLGANRRGRRAADLVTLLLKKRLFSSPEAFGRTVGVYRETLASGRRAGSGGQGALGSLGGFAGVGCAAFAGIEDESWLDDFFDTTADLDDEALAAEEETALGRAGKIETSDDPTRPGPAELALLEQMEDWARHHTANPDAKATALIAYLREVCQPGGRWGDERVVVFTEYRDTQTWLERLLRQEGLGGDKLELLHGGLSGADRERLRRAFQTRPGEHPVRILLATDAASEGIDLHFHCHRLVNYDIPFNPNRLEQRIGRIDRYGQRRQPQVHHFVGAGWEHAHDGFAADLEFLSRVARKVSQMAEDLGSVNAVLAEAVQRRMLGERLDVDAALSAKTTQRRRGRVASDADISGQVKRLREQLDRTVETLNLRPATVRRVVDTALDLARQQPLRPAGGQLFEVPPLTGAWARATAGLAHPDHPERIRPVTFDQAVAAEPDRGDDVVLAHLNHPLVAMSTRLLQAAVSSADTDLHRVAAVLTDDSAVDQVIAVSYARLLILGADGIRLHEEVLHAGGWVRDDGRFARLDNLGLLDRLLTAALADGRPAPGHIGSRLAGGWSRTRDGLIAALHHRRDERLTSLHGRLAKRRDDEERRITANLDRFAATLRQALDDADAPESEYTQLALAIGDEREAAQLRADRAAWQARLERLDAERDAELARIAHRYTDPTPHLFPVAVIYLVPRREATR
ncbi:MAG: DISARM system SNF2-like helicase DrmD [Micromonosporaceae bacterium]|nr:DISARM system SNF2-like helicase DrmD [Micromonosporaceae bacterium]